METSYTGLVRRASSSSDDISESKYCTAKCISLSTLMTICSLAAIAIGTLALLHVSIFDKIGMIGGISLVGGGGAGLIVLAIVSVILYCRSKPKEPTFENDEAWQERPYVFDTPQQTYLNPELLSTPEAISATVFTPPPPRGFSLGSSSPVSSPANPDEVPKMYRGHQEFWQRAAEKVGISNPYSRLEELYGEKAHISLNHETTDDITDAQAAIYLMSDQQIRELSLEDIKEFSYHQMAALHIRLGRQVSFLEDSSKEGTLGAFWFKIIDAAELKTLHRNLQGLLITEQILTLLPRANKGEVAIMLPIRSSWGDERYNDYSKNRLQEMGTSVFPSIAKLTENLLNHIPVDLFYHDDFPWDQADLDAIFNSSYQNWERNKAILKKLPMERIIALASRLPVHCLTSMPTDKLNDPTFPWSPFIQKAGVGNQLRLLKLEILNIPGLPWAEFAVQPAEVRALCAIGNGWGDDTFKSTKELLKGLNPAAVSLLVPHLTADHLRLISKEILRDPTFPWTIFFKQEGIASRLRDLPVFDLEYLPWNELKPNEARILLSLDRGYQDATLKQTTLIVGQMPLRTVRTLAPHFQSEHLRSMDRQVIQDPTFPWDVFFTKTLIGYYLRSLQVIDLDTFPWDQLAQYPKEVAALFEIAENSYGHEATNKQTEALVGQLTLPAIKVLAPQLKVDHLQGIKKEVLEDPLFPWTPFIKKSGFVYFLRRSDVVAPLPHFPWAEFVGVSNGVKEAFSLDERSYSNDKERTKKLFSLIPVSALGVLAPALSVEHLSCMDRSRLAHQDFPWPIFLQKHGIGSRLRHLDAIDLHTFPWAELVQNPDAVDALFEIDENYSYSSSSTNQTTQKLVGQLTLPAITLLAPLLKAGHLKWIKKEVLADPQFPWAGLIKKNGFVQFLRDSDIINLPDFPWAELMQRPQTIDDLFNIQDQYTGEKAKKLLAQLSMNTITTLAPVLKSEHMNHLNRTHVHSTHFPWAAFFKKSDIGKQLRNLDVIFVDQFPWDDFIKNKDEVDELFSTDHYQLDRSKTLYRQLKPEVRQKVATVLLKSHISKLTS